MPWTSTEQDAGTAGYTAAWRLSPESALEEQPVTPPVPESLSLLRWRWILLSSHHAVRVLYWPPWHPTLLS